MVIHHPSEMSIPVPWLVKQSLQWWLNPLNYAEGRRWAHANPVRITTDASTLVWGISVHRADVTPDGLEPPSI